MNAKENTKTIIVEQKNSNNIGLAGFILSIIGLLFGLLHPIAFIALFVGFILSFIGIFRKPSGFAVAGFLIALISIIVIIALIVMVIYFLGKTEFYNYLS